MAKNTHMFLMRTDTEYRLAFNKKNRETKQKLETKPRRDDNFIRNAY